MCRHDVPTLRSQWPKAATTKIHQELQIVPSSSLAFRPVWGNHCGLDDRDCHTQPRRTNVPKRVATPLTSGCAPGPDIATLWTCPTPAYTHTAKLCTNNTHSQGHRAVCPSATHMSMRKGDRTKPGRGMQPQQRKHIGAIPPSVEDTSDRRQTRRKGKGGWGS